MYIRLFFHHHSSLSSCYSAVYMNFGALCVIGTHVRIIRWWGQDFPSGYSFHVWCSWWHRGITLTIHSQCYDLRKIYYGDELIASSVVPTKNIYKAYNVHCYISMLKDERTRYVWNSLAQNVIYIRIISPGFSSNTDNLSLPIFIWPLTSLFTSTQL